MWQELNMWYGEGVLIDFVRNNEGTYNVKYEERAVIGKQGTVVGKLNISYKSHI